MKNLFLITLTLIAGLLIYSCSKQGATGPQGATGIAGSPGNILQNFLICNGSVKPTSLKNSSVPGTYYTTVYEPLLDNYTYLTLTGSYSIGTTSIAKDTIWTPLPGTNVYVIGDAFSASYGDDSIYLYYTSSSPLQKPIFYRLDLVSNAPPQ